MNELIAELNLKIETLERVFNSLEDSQTETKTGILNRIDAYAEVLTLIDNLTPQ